MPLVYAGFSRFTTSREPNPLSQQMRDRLTLLYQEKAGLVIFADEGVSRIGSSFPKLRECISSLSTERASLRCNRGLCCYARDDNGSLCLVAFNGVFLRSICAHMPTVWAIAPRGEVRLVSRPCGGRRVRPT